MLPTLVIEGLISLLDRGFAFFYLQPFTSSTLNVLQVLMESCDRFFEFMKRSNAVSPTIALETATALQVMVSIFNVRLLQSLLMMDKHILFTAMSR